LPLANGGISPVSANSFLQSNGASTPSWQSFEWIDVPFNAGNFSASTGTWTVTALNQTTFTYVIMGKTMILSCYIANTSVSATPTFLQMLIPGGYLPASQQTYIAEGIDSVLGGVPTTAIVVGGAGIIFIQQLTGVPWNTSVGATAIYFTISIRIQ